MKRSQALAVLALALLVAASFPVQQAAAQTAYTERLNVFIAGGNSLWYLTFAGNNGSAKLGGLESTAGLSWYNLTEIRTSGLSSDSQVFGPNGYNVFPVASPPGEGALLTVGSDSFADATAAAAQLGGWLLTQFVSSANGTGSYSFYAPLTFNTMAPKTLLSLVPNGEGGFAGAIASSGFDASQSPFVILEGVKSSSGFQHTLVVGSITPTALDSSFRPNVLNIYGTTLSSLRASNHSASSIVQIRVLDGVIKSNDHATVVNDSNGFDGSYTLSLSPSQRLTVINATVLQQPPTLLAYRTVSRGILHTGQKLQVTDTLTDLSASQALNNITFSDNWWNSTGTFTLLGAANSTTFPRSISGGKSFYPVYTLNYTGTGAGQVTIPASVITYRYQLGSATFEGRAVMNPITIYLGKGGPVVYSYVVPTGGYGKTLGSQQAFQVSAFNAGNESASSVVVAGKSISGLAPNATAQVAVTQAAPGITRRNTTQLYTTTYQDLAGDHLSSTTNLVPNLFSHSSMKLGLPAMSVTETVAPFKGAHGTNLTLTFVVFNRGNANLSSFSTRVTLPRSIACGTTKGNGTTCSLGVITINYSKIAPLAALASYAKLNVTAPENFILPPSSFSATSSGFAEEGNSEAVGIPAGFAVQKAFAPSQLFGGTTSTVSLVATNTGPFTIYNATFGSSVDSFDSVSSTAVTSKTASIAPQGSSTLTYTVKALSTEGNLTSTGSTSSFYFGGTQFAMTFSGPKVSIYQPLKATITTSPSSTIEGKPFTMSVIITNPSGVPVSNVFFSLAVPSGLAWSQFQGMSLIGKNVTVQASSLGAHSSLNASAIVQASSGITVPFKGATLTFSYGGVTVSGTVPTGGIAIGENVTTRYVLPIGLVILVLLGAVYYIRKMSVASVQASRR